MAKLECPLLSQDAHGTIGGVLTFSKRKTGNQVRHQLKQKDYENANREPIREAFALGVELWGSLPQDEKGLWDQVEKKGYANV